MPWRILPLHTPGEEPSVLPAQGDASVGRRPTNTVICRDLAVSGQHCILHCRGTNATDNPELEDCSTNGSYVNDAKLSKGQRRILEDGDIVSLTKPAEEEEGQVAGDLPVPTRVQYKLEFVEGRAEEPPAVPTVELDLAGAGDPPPTAPDTRVPSRARAAEHGFAQDLLVQEQQSKAKITSELLLSQRKLEEERQSVETMTRELQKVRQQVEDERKRRHEAEEGRDRLSSEAEVLRNERRQLQELKAAHEELQRRHDSAQTDLQARVQSCTQLEAAQEQLRHDVVRATEAQQKASQQHAELQTRTRQAQERAERLELQHAEAQREVDRALEEGARLQKELTTETAAREQLAKQVEDTKERVAQAEEGERSAQEALNMATARRAELDCRATSARTEAESARAALRQAKQRLANTMRSSERLREAGSGFSTELRRRAALWEKSLAEGRFDGLGEALEHHDAPTVETVTCRNDATPIRTQRRVTEDDGCAAEGAVGVSPPLGAAALATLVATTAPAMAAEAAAVVSAGGTDAVKEALPLPTSPHRLADQGAMEPAQTAVCLEDADSRSGGSNRLGRSNVDDVLEQRPEQELDVVKDDALLAETKNLAPMEICPPQGHALNATPIGGTASALVGCSTAWSLELLEDEAVSPDRAVKRFKGAGA